MPPIPRTFRNLQIRGSWKKTLSGELFLLKNDCENGIVIFTTNENLKMLGECKNVLADGTFKSCPPPFEQLYALFGNGDRTVPLVFGLLSGKSTFIYRKFFRTIFRKMRNLRIVNEIECFITDFERGVISALETDYSNIQHFGCYFHFTKAIFRKIQEYGLATPYRENPLLKFFFRKIMSLPFIPADRIMEMIGQFLNDPQVNNTARTGS